PPGALRRSWPTAARARPAAPGSLQRVGRSDYVSAPRAVAQFERINLDAMPLRSLEPTGYEQTLSPGGARRRPIVRAPALRVPRRVSGPTAQRCPGVRR